MNLYTDSKDMLDHLKTIYSDLNCVTTAKYQFRQLYMKASDKFHDFLSEFSYPAAEAGVTEDDWKDELYHKLTTEIQKLCISDSIKDSTSKNSPALFSRKPAALRSSSTKLRRTVLPTLQKGDD